MHVAAMGLVLVVAAALRFVRLDALSMWLDEGSTVYLSHLPWPTVLGLNGPYDPHPPLYYAVVKAVSTAVGDRVGGRLLSAVSGTLTIVVLYLISMRLTSARVGLVAALVLALSPIHIWYSQEARQYALAVLLVAVSYLAVLACYQKPGWRWAVTYGLSTAAAVHIDYSAIFALLPQAVPLALLVHRRRKAALPILGAAALAAVLALPLLPWVAEASRALGSSAQYAVTPEKVGNAVAALFGFGGNAAFSGIPGVGFYWGGERAAWDHGRIIKGVLLVAAAAAMGGGVAQLWRRSRIGFAIAVSMASTVTVAALVSIVRTGFIERSVLYTVLGWALIVGAATTPSHLLRGQRLGPSLRIVGVLSVVVVLVASVFSVEAISRGAIKQDWRGLAADIAVARAEEPDLVLITYPTLASTLIEVYEPDAVRGRAISVRDGPEIPIGWLERLEDTNHVLVAYMAYPGLDRIQRDLQAMGFELQSQRYYPDPLFLESYARPSAGAPYSSWSSPRLSGVASASVGRAGASTPRRAARRGAAQ